MDISEKMNENQILESDMWNIRYENENWFLYHGYDGFDCLDQEYFDEHPGARIELEAIANKMIEQWTKYKHVLEGGDVVDSNEGESG